MPKFEGLPCTAQEQRKEVNTQQVKYQFFKKILFYKQTFVQSLVEHKQTKLAEHKAQGFVTEICSQNSTEGQELEIFTAWNYRSVPLPPAQVCVT